MPPREGSNAPPGATFVAPAIATITLDHPMTMAPFSLPIRPQQRFIGHGRQQRLLCSSAWRRGGEEPSQRTRRPPSPRRSAASPSTAGGRLVDLCPFRPSPSQGPRLSDMPLSEGRNVPRGDVERWVNRAGSIDGGGFSCLNRLGAARASRGRRRRPEAARRMAIDAWRRWEGPRSAERAKT